MKKYRTAAILGLSLLLLMCSETKNPVTGPGEDPTGFKFKSLQSGCGGDSLDTMAEAAFELSQGECKRGLYKGAPEASGDNLADSVLVWFSTDTVWVMHKNAFENCCSVILGEVIQTPMGFDVFEHDTSKHLCRCMCYFDIVTTIYGVSPGVHLIRVFDTSGNLVGEVELMIPPKGDTVIFSSSGDTILVTHQDAFYNCCSEIAVNVVQTARGFDLFERDTSGERCNCMCDFDITTIISGVPEGSYVVRVFDIYGRFLDSAVVDISPKFAAFESSQGECKTGLYKGGPEASGDNLEDSVVVWFNADTVWVMHKNAFENCCSEILSDVERTPQGFDVREYDIATSYCYCLCYFDLVTTIYEVLPGVYVIRVFDTSGVCVGEVELEIPPA
ncbi:MAG: hypothetical protein GTO24_15165 [candidate division Zixibacteria bacterium]|nr:hypothetical protein [candidate division Zixibacteria bacterium]